MKLEFDEMADKIRQESSGKTVIYIPNPGNFGDGVIRHATKCFFYDYGIDHKEINIGYRFGKFSLLLFLLNPVMASKYYYIYGGGGAWHEGCDFGFRNVRFISRFTSNFMVLPSTFAKGFMSKSGTFYARDKKQSLDNQPGSIFCHDMAFYLKYSPAFRSIVYASSRTNERNFFRVDNESRLNNIEIERNEDVSMLSDHMGCVDYFFNKVAEAGVVNTDRLHVAIASALIGRECNLTTNNYFKIQAIYDASIVGNFECIRLKS